MGRSCLPLFGGGLDRVEGRPGMAVDYKRILQLDALGVSQRGISETVPCSRNTVAVVLRTAAEHGVGQGLVKVVGGVV